ncbi:MAG: TolC family protein [Polaribacter sp.]|uniref:TolC family protein n=1 Tax=Polaribacter sp. TaxID=1920175 RepID=UPI002F36128B
MNKYIYIFCFFVFTISVKAQQSAMSLTLDEAIGYALKNSYSTKMADNDIKAAHKKKWETTTIGLPQIDAKVDYQNWLKQQVSLLPARLLDPTAPADALAPVTFGTKQNLNATITLKQLIFDGSYLVGLQSAKTYLKISEQAKEKTELGTKEAVINAYGNVLVAEKSIEILKQNKIVLEKNLNDVKKIFENGLNEEEDVEQLEITLGNLNNQLNNVSRMKVIAYKMLNLTLGNSINTELKLSDSLDTLIDQNINLNLASQDFNLNNHIDFKIAQNDREGKRLLMKLEQSKALPSLSAFVNYGYTGNSDSFTFLKSDQKWFNSSLLGVSLNVPIFSSFKRNSKTAQAQIALDNADIKIDQIKEQLSLQVTSSKSDYQLSIENYQTAKKNLALAQRIEKKQQIKFFEGITTSFDLAQAQNQLYTQQQKYIQSMLEVISKKAALENALNLPIN